MPQNTLYPVFLKLDKLPMLLVGAGYVGYEKLSLILKSSPQADITVVALEISEDIRELAALHPQVRLMQKAFEPKDLEGKKLVIAGTADAAVNKQVWAAAQEKAVLANIADTPELCDFYLGSIVTKGNLKIAISTNGQSPTFAKRFREMLEELLPDSIDDILQRLHEIRNRLKGDFQQKINQLDEITSVLTKDSGKD
jgi:precorrin-2 dehydrogenase / sirohydrochlorin ferrochelatase